MTSSAKDALRVFAERLRGDRIGDQCRGRHRLRRLLRYYPRISEEEVTETDRIQT